MGHHIETLKRKPETGVLTLNSIDEKIAAVEVLYRNEVRTRLEVLNTKVAKVAPVLVNSDTGHVNICPGH
jgi:hypothetical protein